ncbi:helix-turn-helix domain-containing protein [Gaiella sp.]|jgi:DNA-binding transcriptional ArsR family regulator|uniref:winged helix-turn-helix domain-containing protein n=1 Tax=Gaiella sp. TaxID=2663207 RepID=UPI002E302E4E|nr:helix-turn-helix domain-containing protein [Gaiella sp.]HEX5583315.1 helix-turn-helix domain-containing protein [Gaiella sp.]
MERQIELTDAAAMRALVHPVRIRLLALLRREGALTASEAGRRLGESSGSTSYHLRQLARFGLVEEAGGAHGRARPWRATSLYTSWPAVPEDEELAEASLVLDRFVVNRYAERLAEWIERRRDEPREWVEASAFGDSLLYLDKEELAALRDGLQALAEPYLERVADPTLRPAGARPVAFVQVAFPVDEP